MVARLRWAGAHNDVRNTSKTWQLKQEVLELSSTGIHAGVQRRDWEQTKVLWK